MRLALDWRRQEATGGSHGPPDDDRLAQVLFDSGRLRPAVIRLALATARQLQVPLARVLLAEARQFDPALTEEELCALAAPLWRLPLADLSNQPADPQLIAQIGAARCLALGVVPLLRQDGRLLLAVARPADWPTIAAELAPQLGPVTPCLAGEVAIQQAITAAADAELLARAESRVATAFSVRGGTGGRRWLPLLAVLPLLLWLAPHLAFGVLLVWVVLALSAMTALRAGALLMALARRRHPPPPLPPSGALQLPVISILVPLFGEPDIAPRLLQRLGRLDYPRPLLDVVIVLEARDQPTRTALAACRLPGWMRVVVVPHGSVTTKPRAMNYALDFCRGSIIGIYDAEDAPDRDQLQRVAQRFAAGRADLACLQGALDYYNPRTNLISRLFTAEYAAWFRLVMPALQHWGLPMPLGGTTLFLRRTALERVGAWDAHNVTEDADLGVRLARHDLRTEMLDSTTHEEANCHLRPWIRQRSRWIKGHLLTWAVHMRSPRRLWRDLGWRGFLGYQLVFFGAQSQVLLAPLLWTFWLPLAGLPHPVQQILPPAGMTALFALFLTAEAMVIAAAMTGLSRCRHRLLWPVAALLHPYHALAAVAGWRALWEAFRNPFYWSKTSHGHYDHVGLEKPPARESAAERLARSLNQPEPTIAVQRIRSSPASIFSRVSNAREIWVRNASQAASPSRAAMASTMAPCSASATESRPSAASEVEASSAIERWTSSSC